MGERLRRFAETVPWQDVERKPLTVTFHYRARRARPRRARCSKSPSERGRTKLVARFGRMVLELRPPLDANKGTAVRHLLEERGLTRALYAGDDTTDLDAFAAVETLELGVQVAVASPEGLHSSARPPTSWSTAPPSC